MIDVVEPFFRVIVELGYDRSIQPWEPTPARLIPTLDPAKVAADLVDAIGEGINNALALIGANAPGIPAAPAGDDRAIGHLRADDVEGGGNQPNVAQEHRDRNQPTVAHEHLDRTRQDAIDRTRAGNRTALDGHSEVDEG